MINEVSINNFKSLNDVNAAFGDFTVLVGQNNSGKSALLEALIYYDQALYNANTWDDVREPASIDYSFRPDVVAFRDADGQADNISVAPTFDISNTSVYPELKEVSRDTDIHDDLPSTLQIGARFDADGWTPIFYTNTEDTKLDLCSVSDKGINTSAGTVAGELGNFPNVRVTDNETVYRFFNLLGDAAQECMDRRYYISNRRQITNWDADPAQNDFVGTEGESTVSMIPTLDDEVFERVVDAVSDILPSISGVEGGWEDDRTRTELKDTDTGELFNVVASGSGLRYLLPIIVQIAKAEDGDTIIVEEPELSVFPDTQEKLVEFMLDNVRDRGVQIIITTHSHPFIRKVQHIADRSDGHALEFEKTDGQTKIAQNRLGRMINFSEFYGGADTGN